MSDTPTYYVHNIILKANKFSAIKLSAIYSAIYYTANVCGREMYLSSKYILDFLEVTKWLIKHPVYTRFLSTENGYVVTKSQNDGSGDDSYAKWRVMTIFENDHRLKLVCKFFFF